MFTCLLLAVTNSHVLLPCGVVMYCCYLLPCIDAYLCPSGGFHVRKRNALPTTHKLEQLIAAAAIMGFKVRAKGTSTPAATGIQITL